jgi:amino acid transporter
MSSHISKEMRTMNKSQTGTLVLFRQAATAMSAGILLMVVGSPAPAFYLGFLFSSVSVVFLVTALIQAFPRWRRFPDDIKRLGDDLTFSFILISLTGIIVNWARILKAVTEGNDGTDAVVAKFQHLSSVAVPIWVIAFALIFCFVSVVGISRGIRSDKERFGLRRTVYRYMAAAGLVGGLLGISSPLLNSNVSTRVQWTLFILSVPLVIGMVIYLYRELRSTRRSLAERKENARESAINASTMARLIGDSLTFNYPSRTLKAILDVPLKQLEDELETLKAYRNALK